MKAQSKVTFSNRNGIETIDTYIRKFGYTVTRDFYTKNGMTLRKLFGDCWLFEGKLTKYELVEFANSL